jgi:aminoglycoside phosphotransferase (APT) family kinase protein
VLDWELSTIGHPLADFAYHCMYWHIPAHLFRGLGGMDLKALGIPSEEDCIAAYCRFTRRSGIDPGLWTYCMAYNLFRLAAIFQGIKGRVSEGNAASPEALDTARDARPLADLGWSLVENVSVRPRF